MRSCLTSIRSSTWRRRSEIGVRTNAFTPMNGARMCSAAKSWRLNANGRPRRGRRARMRTVHDRRQIMSRIVVKVGSSSLTTAEGGLDPDRVHALVDAIVDVRGSGEAGQRTGDEVVLVSSGAIAAGLAPLGLVRRPRDLATQQAAASVGQGL